MLNTVYPNYIPQRPVYNNNQAMMMQPQIAPVQPIQNPVPMPSVQPVAPIQQTQIASLEAANAIKAYSTPFIYQTMPETSNEYIMRLKNTGKVEGKDFRIEKGDGYIDVVELDAGNKMIKSSAWNLIDGKEKPLGTEDFVYKGDRILYRDAKTPDGKIEHHAHHYYNDEIPQSTISHDGLTFETKVEDYINKIYREMTRSLNEAGLGDVVVKKRNYYAINPDRIKCDRYDFEKGKSSAIKAYMGEYMQQYAWATFKISR